MCLSLRHITTVVLLPCMLMYIHGVSVIWLIYQFEWEDIVTHHCQQYSLQECDGKQYVNGMLDATSTDAQRLPQPPATVDELRATIDYNSTITAALVFRFISHSHSETILRGFSAEISHPPW